MFMIPTRKTQETLLVNFGHPSLVIRHIDMLPPSLHAIEELTGLRRDISIHEDRER